MKTRITLQERLKDLRTEKRLSLKQLADETGLSSSALGEYENDENKGIPHFVLVQLAEYYDVSLDYLFDRTEVRKNTNTAIDELNLDDKAIDLLKSGEINNRLLSEMVCHPEFRKFLADAEIYVDGIAGQSIQTINAYADAIRKRITTEFNPAENDPGILILDACRIEEDRYFLNKLQIDIEPVVKDIRQAHIGDKESAADMTIADKANEIFDEVKKGENTFLDTLTSMFCKEIGLTTTSLSPEEHDMLHSLFVRSRKYKQVMNNTKNSKKRKR